MGFLEAFLLMTLKWYSYIHMRFRITTISNGVSFQCYWCNHLSILTPLYIRSTSAFTVCCQSILITSFGKYLIFFLITSTASLSNEILEAFTVCCQSILITSFGKKLIFSWSYLLPECLTKYWKHFISETAFRILWPAETWGICNMTRILHSRKPFSQW